MTNDRGCRMGRRIANLCAGAAALALGGAFAQGAQAQTDRASTAVFYQFGGALGDGNNSQIIDQKGSLVSNALPKPLTLSIPNVQNGFSAGGASAEDSVTVRAAVGNLGVKIRGSADASGPGASVSSSIFAQASFTDLLTVNGPGLVAGTHIKFHQKLSIDGTNAVAASTGTFDTASSDLQLSVTGTGLALTIAQGLLVDDGINTGFEIGTNRHDKEAPPFILQTIDLIVGEQVVDNVNMIMTGAISADNAILVGEDSSGVFIGDYAHTLAIMPGAFFTDTSGNVLTGLDLTSASGFDYLNPPAGDSDPFGGVPEPATWALLIGGFGLAGAQLRRRRAAAV